MKNLSYLLLVFMTISCKQSSEKKLDTEGISDQNEIKTELNLMVPDTIDDNMMLIGMINEEGLQDKEFIDWYKENYNGHILDTITINEIKPKINEVTIKVFMGTWCSDSQREVAALYKILNEAEYDISKLEIIALSQEKDTPDHLEKGFNIEYVPTIIFYKNEIEIGRFVELAQDTLEKDMLAILSETGYKHSYEE
ncbi:MAG: thiol-disulfide isomerase/thioredoxin [bacterium]|jgi:thiol-disulfide isomerase/thioredoxin